MKKFSAAYVARVCGISQRQIQHWELTGLIRPLSRDKNERRQFTLHELFIVVIICCLRAVGVSIQRQHEIIPEIRHMLAELDYRLEKVFVMILDYESTRPRILVLNDISFTANENFKEKLVCVSGGYLFEQMKRVANSPINPPHLRKVA